MKSALKITVIYIAFASLWILLSDRLIALMSSDAATLTYYASLKGMLFVAVTSTLLFLLVLGDAKRIDKVVRDLNSEVAIKEQLNGELHRRIGNTIQLMIGILDVEALDADFTVDARRKIRDKLASMESIFNVVYANAETRDVSIKKVLDVYSAAKGRDLRVRHLYEGNALSLETTVSLLLVIDSVLSGIERNGIRGRIDLEVKSNEVLDFFIDRTDMTVGSLLGDDEYFALFFLKALDGSLTILDGHKTDIRVIFKDKTAADARPDQDS